MGVGTSPNVIEIKKGWYYMAGERWGWALDGLDVCGVGINMSYLLDGSKEVHVKVAGKTYRLGTEEAREFINKYKSRCSMPGGSFIGVISASILEEIV